MRLAHTGDDFLGRSWAACGSRGDFPKRVHNLKRDLLNPEFLDQHGSIVATNVMRKGLNQLRTSYSKELINFAIKEEWSSLSPGKENCLFRLGP